MGIDVFSVVLLSISNGVDVGKIDYNQTID